MTNTRMSSRTPGCNAQELQVAPLPPAVINDRRATNATRHEMMSESPVGYGSSGINQVPNSTSMAAFLQSRNGSGSSNATTWFVPLIKKLLCIPGSGSGGGNSAERSASTMNTPVIRYPENAAQKLPPMSVVQERHPAETCSQSGKVTLEALDLAEPRIVTTAERRRKPQEILSIDQSRAIELYGGYDYHAINQNLRESTELPSHISELAANMQSGLLAMRAQGYVKDGKSFRGSLKPVLAETPSGRTATVPEFLSTSMDTWIAESFASVEDRALISVFGDGGVDVHSYGPLPNDEKELIYTHSSSFLVGGKVGNLRGPDYPKAITQDRVRGDGKYHAPTSNPKKDHVVALQWLTQRLQERLGDAPALQQLAQLLKRIKETVPAEKSSGETGSVEPLTSGEKSAIKGSRLSIDDLTPTEHASLVLRQANHLVSLLPPGARKGMDREMRDIEESLRPLAADWRSLVGRSVPSVTPTKSEPPEGVNAPLPESKNDMPIPPNGSEATLEEMIESLYDKVSMSRKEYSDKLLQALPLLGHFDTPGDLNEELIELISDHLEEGLRLPAVDFAREFALATALLRRLKESDRLFNLQSSIIGAISHVAGHTVTSIEQRKQADDLVNLLEEAGKILDGAQSAARELQHALLA